MAKPREVGGLPPAVLTQKLKLLVGIRLLFTSVLLGSTVGLDLHEKLPFQTAPLYGLLGLTFGLSLLYALALRGQHQLVLQGLIQLALDLLLVSLLVHFTGGLDSVFAFMYMFAIFAAAQQLRQRGVLAVGILSAVLYAGLVFGEWTRLIAPVQFAGGAAVRSVGYAVYQVLIHAVAFFAVALLSSHLADRLRQAGLELERRGLDFRNLQALHQAIVASISSGLMTFDLAGRLVSFNEAAERISGYPFGELRDRPLAETPFAGCPPMVQFFAHPEASSVQAVSEIELQRRDGRLIPVGISCSTLRNTEDRVAGLIAIFQDLTERKRVEDQLRQADRLAALGHLAATIAHEVRNPLAAISGAVEVLRDDLQGAGEHQALLSIILGEAHRLKLITGQFLDFAKPQPLLFRPCAVRPLLEETLRLLERSSEWHADTTWSLQEEFEDLRALADADQLRQVVWNLCINAIQSMPDGGKLSIFLRIALSLPGGRGGPGETDAGPGDGLPKPQDWIEIAVSDTGRGIPAEDLERIFDPFYTTRASGTGLGLAIARKALERMAGRIGVESRPGVGTTFRVWLRRAPAAVPVGGGDQIGRPHGH